MIPTMSFGNIVDQLHDQDSLADSSATKQSNLASSLIGSKQVHHLKPQRCWHNVFYKRLQIQHGMIELQIVTLIPVTRISCSVP